MRERSGQHTVWMVVGAIIIMVVVGLVFVLARSGAQQLSGTYGGEISQGASFSINPDSWLAINFTIPGDTHSVINVTGSYTSQGTVEFAVLSRTQYERFTQNRNAFSTPYSNGAPGSILASFPPGQYVLVFYNQGLATPATVTIVNSIIVKYSKLISTTAYYKPFFVPLNLSIGGLYTANATNAANYNYSRTLNVTINYTYASNYFAALPDNFSITFNNYSITRYNFSYNNRTYNFTYGNNQTYVPSSGTLPYISPSGNSNTTSSIITHAYISTAYPNIYKAILNASLKGIVGKLNINQLPSHITFLGCRSSSLLSVKVINYSNGCSFAVKSPGAYEPVSYENNYRATYYHLNFSSLIFNRTQTYSSGPINLWEAPSPNESSPIDIYMCFRDSDINVEVC